MKLTTKTRAALPKSDFALPGKYPITDKSHAINAKARATQMYDKGVLNAGQRETVNRKANMKLRTNGKGR